MVFINLIAIFIIIATIYLLAHALRSKQRQVLAVKSSLCSECGNTRYGGVSHVCHIPTEGATFERRDRHV